MGTNKKTAGFGMIGIILLSAVVIALGFVGWRVYDAHYGQKQPDVAASKQTPVDANAGYVVIKEWGVRIPLSEKTKGMTYAIDGSNAFAFVSTPRLDELAKQNSECAEAYKSVSIGRIKLGDDYMGKPLTESDLGRTWVKIENYYYYSGVAQPCFGGSQAAVTEIGDIRTALIESIKSVERAR